MYFISNLFLFVWYLCDQFLTKHHHAVLNDDGGGGRCKQLSQDNIPWWLVQHDKATEVHTMDSFCHKISRWPRLSYCYVDYTWTASCCTMRLVWAGRHSQRQRIYQGSFITIFLFYHCCYSSISFSTLGIFYWSG